MPDLVRYIFWNGDAFVVMLYAPGTWQTAHDILLSPTEQDADERRGRVVNKRHVLQYSDDLWVECATYNERKEERLNAIADERSKLLRRYNLRDNQPRLF